VNYRTLRRVLIANRGEVALRIVRACRDAGIETVITYSEADRDSLPVRLADRAVCIGGPAPTASYLQIDQVVAAAIGSECDAIHPGWGFLAEVAEFADRCEEAGLSFIGPRGATIRLLGDKIAARQTAIQAGVPVIPGSPGRLDGMRHTAELAARIGYPLLVKAGGGGGGRGLRLVHHADEIAEAVRTAAAEASAAFGNDAVYLERFVARARHVEVQVAGDGRGAAIQFGERDCSIQRKYQKLVEESPSPALTDERRSAITTAAVQLVSHVSYRGLGTVEFLLDQDTGEFFFIEMNTRLQVEHPVTELVTGHDLVRLQLDLAAGLPLPTPTAATPAGGHAIELRINAEDSSADFSPQAGTITEWQPPHGPWVRVDTHCYRGYLVPPHYDSLLAKLIVFGPTRDEALARARRALGEFVVEGVATTLPFHRWLLAHEDFVSGRFHTAWLAERGSEVGAA
jgi:acetyl-CoA carboxylase biotin carboxylase subunit